MPESVVGFDGMPAGLLELIFPLHGSFGRPFAGDLELQVDDGLLAVDDEDAVPPLAGLSDLKAHQGRNVGRTLARSGAVSCTGAQNQIIAKSFGADGGLKA